MQNEGCESAFFTSTVAFCYNNEHNSYRLPCKRIFGLRWKISNNSDPALNSFCHTSQQTSIPPHSITNISSDWESKVTLILYSSLHTGNNAIINLSGGAKKIAQLLVWQSFTTHQQNSAELRSGFSQHVLNDTVNFQSHWITNVEMMVCPKIQYRGYQQYWMCMAHTLHGHAWHTAVKKEVPGLSKDSLVRLWCQIIILITANTIQLVYCLL